MGRGWAEGVPYVGWAGNGRWGCHLADPFHQAARSSLRLLTFRGDTDPIRPIGAATMLHGVRGKSFPLLHDSAAAALNSL